MHPAALTAGSDGAASSDPSATVVVSPSPPRRDVPLLEIGTPSVKPPDAISAPSGEAPEARAVFVRAHHSSKGRLRQVTVATLSRALSFSRTAWTKKLSSSS